MKFLFLSLTLVILSFLVKFSIFDSPSLVNIESFNQIIFIFLGLYVFGICFSLIELERSQLKVRPGGYGFLFLIAWTAIIVQGGVVIGVAVNYSSIYSEYKAVKAYRGTEIVLRQDKDAQLTGEIGTSTFQSLKTLHRETSFNNLYIMSPGGLISEAKKIAGYLYENNISVIVDNVCASACLIVATGTKKLISSSEAKFGFHRGTSLTRDNSQYSRFIGENATNTLYTELKKSEIPEWILSKMNKTPNSEMYWVSGVDLHSMGVVKHLIK